MKYIFSIITIIIFGGLVQLFLPWWSFLIVTLSVAFLFKLTGWQGFLCGFLGIFLLWGTYAFYLNQVNEGILASRMSGLFSMPGASIGLLLFSALIGALIGGLAGATGALGRQLA